MYTTLYHHLRNINTLIFGTSQLNQFTTSHRPEYIGVFYFERSIKRSIWVDEMSKPSGAYIDERVRRFAESVRNGEQGFKPGESWWLVRRTSK